MGKGRKPIPAEIRKLQGNPGRRPIPEAPKSAPIDGDFPPPDWMDAEAKKEWRRVVKAYDKIKLLTETDKPMLETWCVTVSQFIAAAKKLGKKTKDLSEIRNNRLSLNEARTSMLALSSRFGFSPVDRLKLAIPPEKDKDENDIINFLNRNKKKA